MKALLGKLIDVKLGLLENNEDMLPVMFPSETISIVCSCVLKVKAFGCMGFANKFPDLILRVFNDSAFLKVFSVKQNCLSI